MADPKFYIGDLAGVTSDTASGGEQSGYPVINLKNYFSDNLWKSNSTANNQTLIRDFGTARAINAIVLHGHNFSGMTVLLEYDTNDSSGFENPVTALSMSAVGPNPYINTFTSHTKRYWRLKFTSTGGSYPQIGNYFLETEFDFGLYAYPWADYNEEFRTSEGEALSGRKRTAQSILGRLRHEIIFKLVDSTVRTNFQRFIQKVRGKGCPFYYVNPSAAISYMKFTIDYVPIIGNKGAVYDTVALPMESVDVNQNPL
jgi:hypothetical protein